MKESAGQITVAKTRFCSICNAPETKQTRHRLGEQE
jgi:hypothetical protein